MLINILQTTLAFAPAPDDLDEIYFDAPIIAFAPSDRNDEESEPGEP